MRQGRWLGQFQVHYQPIVDCRTGALLGMEALVRWRHPERGVLPAGDFVDTAERTGLIGSLDVEVLRSAGAFRRRLPLRRGVELRLSVNTTTQDLTKVGTFEEIQRTIEETRADPSQIEFEVGGVGTGPDPRGAESVLRRMRGLGLSIAVDDAGVVEDLETTLATFPIDAIKLDLSAADSPSGLEALRTAVTMGRAREIRVTAKHVETLEHLRVARELDFDAAQGYALGRPTSSAEFEAMLGDAGMLDETAEDSAPLPRRLAA